MLHDVIHMLLAAHEYPTNKMHSTLNRKVIANMIIISEL